MQVSKTTKFKFFGCSNNDLLLILYYYYILSIFILSLFGYFYRNVGNKSALYVLKLNHFKFIKYCQNVTYNPTYTTFHLVINIQIF